MSKNRVIEIFSIGTELTLGQIQDTNSHWISQQIFKLGGTLRRVTMLRDSFDEMIEAFRDAIDRKTDLVLTTGGLGPTPDDMTVSAIAEVIDRKVIIDEETVKSYMMRRNIADRSQVSEGLLKMANAPENSEVFQNRVGWAPCILTTHDETTFMLMPGPPREMTSVFDDHVSPIISQRYSTTGKSIRVYVDLSESGLSPCFQKIMSQFPSVYMKGYVALRNPNGSGLPVDIVATANDHESTEKILQLALDQFRQFVESHGKTIYF